MDRSSPIRPYEVLSKEGMEIENVADPSEKTCSDCRQIRTIPFNLITLARKVTIRIADYFGRTINKVTGLPEISHECYECGTDNIIDDIKAEKKLTSGYSFGGQDKQNKVIPKPKGKCSHGGLIDKSQTEDAKGGINKDTMLSKLASHHSLHLKAAAVAVEHSIQLMQSIRSDVGNDVLFSEYLGFEIDSNIKISVSIVIDPSQVSSSLIAEVQRSVHQIENDIQQQHNIEGDNLQISYVLVSLLESGNYTIAIQLLNYI